MKELIDRLRGMTGDPNIKPHFKVQIHKAADALEAAEAENERLRGVYEAAKDLHRHLYPVGEGAEECDERLRKALAAVHQAEGAMESDDD